MAVKSKEELLNALKAKIGDDDSDDTLAFIEDVTDTIDDLNKRVSDSGDWKAKYEQNDKEWRQKYRDRFFSGNNDDDFTPGGVDSDDDNDDDKPKTFDDLFTVEK